MDELLIGQAPHSPEAERATLGAILTDPARLSEVMKLVRAEDFYFPLHRELFRIVCELFAAGKPIDPVLARDALVTELYTKQEASAYIAELANAAPVLGNVQSYAAIVETKAILRRAQKAALQAVQLAAEGGELSEVQEALHKALAVTEAKQGTGSVTLGDATLALYHDLKEREKQGGGIAGLASGFSELDKLLGGLRPGNMLVLAGRPGMGKSALGLNIALGTARHSGKLCLFFSLEMNAVELCERVYADKASIGLHIIRDAKLGGEDWRRFGESAKTVTQYPVRIVESPSPSMGDITRICRSEKPALIIIDHLGLIRPDGKQRDRREAIDGISRSLKCLAKDLSIPLIVAAQLNREIMSRANKSPVLSDLRESGAIEQDADAVLFVHRQAYYDKRQEEDEAELIVAKNRHGKTGSIALRWEGMYQRFTEDWTRGDEPTERFPTTYEDVHELG